MPQKDKNYSSRQIISSYRTIYPIKSQKFDTLFFDAVSESETSLFCIVVITFAVAFALFVGIAMVRFIIITQNTNFSELRVKKSIYFVRTFFVIIVCSYGNLACQMSRVLSIDRSSFFVKSETN